jgi:hypothetical protein
MSRHDPHVIRHGDAATPHYFVRFLAGDGESVMVEFHLNAGGADPERETVVDAAWEIVSRLSREAPDRLRRRTSATTAASPAAGLSRPTAETEAETHSSEGRDTGTA